MSKFNFTKAAILSAPIGTHYDTKCAGLVLNVTASSRRYGIYVSVRNMPTRKSLGDASLMSVEAARLKAAEVIRDLRTAKPAMPVKQVTTLGKLAEMFTGHLEMQGRRTSNYVEDAIRLNWNDLRGRDIDSITVIELAERHSKIVKERGPSAANRAITTLRTMYHYAASLELTEKNPAKKVRLIPERSRDVFLTPDEIAVLRRVLKTMPPDAEAFMLLALLTGLRRDNICGMEWSWVDLDGATVTVPAEYSKNGEEITVPLVPEAVSILRGRIGLSDRFVFPSEKSGCGRVVEPWFWVQEARAKMAELGVTKEWVAHDLRRTLAVQMTAAGAPLTVVARALAHKNINTTPIYARASVDTVREWLGKAA